MKHRLCILALAGAVTATSASAAYLEFVVQGANGVIYQLRWGGVEGSADLVDPYPVWGNPLCVKMGTQLGVRMVFEPNETPAQWLVTGSTLESLLTGQLYWLEGGCTDIGGHGLHQPGETHWFPASAPGFVDHAALRGDAITHVPDEGEPPIWGFGSFTTESEVFVVLDAPKEPMAPAWVSFLRYTCKWARYRPDENGSSHWDAETSTENYAAQRVTFGFFFQSPAMVYNGGKGAEWITWDGNSYRYHLKEVVGAWDQGASVWGECMDASVINALALRSLGISYSSRQLRAPDSGFITYPICAIGNDPGNDALYESRHWSFHSVTIQAGQSFGGTTQIWDSCAAQKKNLLDVGYRNPPAFHAPNHTYWTQNGYWHTHVAGRPEADHLGLVFYEVSETWIPVRASWRLAWQIDDAAVWNCPHADLMYSDWLPALVTTQEKGSRCPYCEPS